MPAGLWGRTENALTFVRSLAQAAAPPVFGAISQVVAGIVPAQAPIGTHPHTPSSSTSTGLEVTFLIMLSALAAAGVLLFRARRTFASDVASAAASEAPVSSPSGVVGPHRSPGSLPTFRRSGSLARETDGPEL